MTNKGATVKLTEKQRETLDRLARDLGYGYVGLSFVRPNTWRSLVAAGLVQECVTERGMFKLTEQGCAAAGVKATYMSNVRNAEAFAVIEHLRRGNDSAMRTAEAANLRDSQVLLDAHLKRIGVVGTELVNGRTRLWTVDLDEPDQSPKWIDTDPESMSIFFARAEGRPIPTYMRRADSALVFRVLGGGEGEWGVFLQATTDPRYDIFRTWQELLDDEWTATDHQGVPLTEQAIRRWLATANTALAKTVRDLESKPLDLTTPPAGCPAGNSCTGAAFPGHPAHALEGVLESDEGYHVIGEVPRGKPAVEGVTSSYWVVPIVGERLTDRHDVLGPYATLDLAEYKRDQYTEAGHPCRVLQSVTRPIPAVGDVAYRLRNTMTGAEYRVLGTSPTANAPHMTSVWVQKVGEAGAAPWSADMLSSVWHDFVAVDEHGQPQSRAPFAVGDQVRQLDGETAEVFEVVGETVFVRTADGEVYEHEVDELEPAAAVPAMTLAQYTAHVAASTTPAHRAAMQAGA